MSWWTYFSRGNGVIWLVLVVPLAIFIEAPLDVRIGSALFVLALLLGSSWLHFRQLRRQPERFPVDETVSRGLGRAPNVFSVDRTRVLLGVVIDGSARGEIVQIVPGEPYEGIVVAPLGQPGRHGPAKLRPASYPNMTAIRTDFARLQIQVLPQSSYSDALARELLGSARVD
jgi:hypothetical protein